ncbi:MAG: GAF domain-containing protein [Calditrichia bacterium]
MTSETLHQLKGILRQKEKELYSIQKIGQALSSTLNIDDLLNLVMKEITFLMNADRSTLYLVDRRKKEIWSKIALKAEVKEIRQKFGKGISGYVAETGRKIKIHEILQCIFLRTLQTLKYKKIAIIFPIESKYHLLRKTRGSWKP